MNSKTLLLIGGAVLAVYLLFRSRSADASEPDPADDDNDDGGRRTGGGSSSETTPSIDVSLPVVNVTTPKINTRLPVVNVTTPSTPGATPANPLPSTSLTPSFRGYFKVVDGDTCIKIATRLGSVHEELYRQNPHPVGECPKWVQDKYNNSKATIALLPRYGGTVGEDCDTAPGYKATLYSVYTGILPILHWDGDGGTPI